MLNFIIMIIDMLRFVKFVTYTVVAEFKKELISGIFARNCICTDKTSVI